MALLDIVAKYLPIVATALANPVAGVAELAASFLGPKLGVAPTVDAIAEKLGAMPPEELIKLKSLENELVEHLDDNDVKLSLAQINLNTEETRYGDLFVAGWRPAIGWVGAAGIAYHFIVRPLLNGLIAGFDGPPVFPALELQDLIGIVTLMLGHGALRSFDKKNGTANGS